MVELSLADKFRHYLLPKLQPLQMYVQITYNKEAKCLQVMCFNKLPGRLQRKIPKKYLGFKVVQHVLGSGNVVTNKPKTVAGKEHEQPG